MRNIPYVIGEKNHWRLLPVKGITSQQARDGMQVVLLAIIVIAAARAEGHEVRPCQEVNVGIETLVTPVANNVRSFYNNRVQIYNIDTIEPAAASAGIAIVLPDNEDPLGGSKCLAIPNFAGIDIKAGRPSYDSVNGLSLSIPTRIPDSETGKAKPGPVLNILINLQQTSVKIITEANRSLKNRVRSDNHP